MKAFFLFSFILSLSACSARTRRFISYQFAGPAPVETCGRDGEARWCVYTPAGPVDDSVVYFLHYATGDERSWTRLGLARAFDAEFRRLGKPAPRVATISYGPYWLLTPKPEVRQTVPLADFEAVLDRLDARLGVKGPRFLWGMSQGGYNASVEALSRPGRWRALTLSCPALVATTPFEAPAKETASRGSEGRQLFTVRMTSDASWRAENPLALLAADKKAPPSWIEANRDDEFGYYEGARAFSQALNAAGARSEFVPSPGGHCVVDVRGAARFIARRISR